MQIFMSNYKGPPALPGPRSWSLGNWILVCSPCRPSVPGRLQTGYRQRGCQQHEVKEHGAFPLHESRGGMPQHSPQPTLAGWSAVNSTTSSRPGKTVNCGSEESSEISKQKLPGRPVWSGLDSCRKLCHHLSHKLLIKRRFFQSPHKI